MSPIYPLPRIELISLAQVEETRPVLLVTSPPAWEAVKERLRLPAAALLEVQEATLSHWEALRARLGAWAGLHEAGQSPHPPSRLEKEAVVYAVGGGLTADAGKYLASKLNLPLVCIPTALTVDAFLTWASGIRRDGCVYYIETKPPECLLVDLEEIGSAPAHLRAAGITDVLSIATGAWDWQFAEEKGMNPPGMAFTPWVYDAAQAILQGALDCAAAAGRGDPGGLKQLLDCLAMEVQLCNLIGHSRPEEGSEHYFAYAVENLSGHGWPHGDLVGPGILIAARLQGQATERLEQALRDCHIPLDRLTEAMIAQTLRELPSYCRKHNLAFGIAHTPGQGETDEVLSRN